MVKEILEDLGGALRVCPPSPHRFSLSPCAWLFETGAISAQPLGQVMSKTLSQTALRIHIPFGGPTL